MGQLQTAGLRQRYVSIISVHDPPPRVFDQHVRSGNQVSYAYFNVLLLLVYRDKFQGHVASWIPVLWRHAQLEHMIDVSLVDTDACQKPP